MVSRRSAHDDDTPVYVISVAAELAGMHAQTLRQYDRLGLVTPSRTPGGGRRYSSRDVSLLREVQRLSQEEGISLSGIARILELQARVSRLQAQVDALAGELESVREATSGKRVFAVTAHGDIYPSRFGERPRFAASRALVLYRP